MSRMVGQVLTSTAAAASLDLSSRMMACVVRTQADLLTCGARGWRHERDVPQGLGERTRSPHEAPPLSGLPAGAQHTHTSTIILTVGSVVARFWGCGGRTVTGTQPQYRQP